MINNHTQAKLTHYGKIVFSHSTENSWFFTYQLYTKFEPSKLQIRKDTKEGMTHKQYMEYIASTVLQKFYDKVEVIGYDESIVENMETIYKNNEWKKHYTPYAK